jgi:signal transduction histidine kinase/ligand-binding sensor domain-containing protein
MKKEVLKAVAVNFKKRFSFYCLFQIFSLFIIQPLFSQYFIHRTLTTADGLPSDYVNHLFQDRQGYMWISTDKGVCKFDGKNFNKITVDDGLPNNFITSAHQDEHGDMWFGSFSDNPLTHFASNGIKNYPIGYKGIKQIFFDSRNRVYLADAKKFICLQQPLALPEVQKFLIQALQISKDSFLVMYPGKLYLIDVSKDKPGVFEMPYNTEKLYGRMFMSEKKIYILGMSLMCIDDASKPWPWKAREMDKGNFISSSSVFTDTSILFGSYKGLFEYSFSSKKIVSINHRYNLPEIGINYLYIDKQGSLWIATHGNGIIICPKNPVCITEHEDDRIVAISAGENQVAAATVSELMNWKPHELTSIAKNNFYQHSGLYYYNGLWWLSDYQFLYGPAKTLQELYKSASINIPNGISSFYIDADKNEYIGTYADGIVRRVKGRVIDSLNVSDGLCSNTIEKVVAIPAGIAALSYSNGFSIIGPQDVITNFDKKDGLLSNTVYSIAQKGDTLLVGTEGGLTILVNGKWVHNERLDERTTGNRILAFFSDKQGRHFFLSNKCLFIREGLTIKPLRSQKILTRDREIITCCFYQPERDVLFIGTSRGIAYFQMQKVIPDPVVPDLILEKVNNQNQDLTMKKEAAFRGPENLITFQFTAQTFLTGLTPEIHVRLAGFDSSFSILSGNYILSYQNLPPGTYQLEAFMVNGDGFRSELRKLYQIIIKPVWWQTPWFMVFSIAIAAAISAWLVWGYQQRRYQNKLALLKLKEEKQIQRERIRRDLHDNIGSQLSYMVSQLDWMEQNANTYSSGKMQQNLSSLGENAREIVNELRESMWSLKFDMITIDMLSQRMQQILQKIQNHADGPEISFHTDVAGEVPISPHTALNVLRIFQESLSNALKHAKAQKIKVTLKQIDSTCISMQITDDGIGFKPNEARHTEHYGLEIMERRAADLDIALQIISTPGNGTSVVADIKLA